MSTFRFAACQLHVTDDKAANIANCRAQVRTAVEEHKADVVALPECWNSPYGTQSFPIYAEPLYKPDDSPSYQAMSDMAREHGVVLIGGSVPERGEDGRLYNTCLSFGADGSLIGSYRKMHLFDIDVPGKITFKESETLSAGNQFCVLDTNHCKIGIAICYDVRFPEIARHYQEAGCQMIVYPGAFNTTTGPAHWELLMRARALDYQLYVGAVSPSRVPGPGYQAWGHSSVVSPWGEVVATTEHEPTVISCEIQLPYVDEVRQQIPVLSQRRLTTSTALPKE